MLDINTIDYDFCINTSIENNMKEVLQFAEDNGYFWNNAKTLPTDFKFQPYIIIHFYPKEKVITHGYNKDKKEHKLSDFQSEFNEELIKGLREGKIALRNDGNLEDLRKVLKYAFPKDNWIIGGVPSFYKLSEIDGYWEGLDKKPHLIIHSVNDFLKTNKTIMENKTFKITRQQLEEIHNIACNDWKIRIVDITDSVLGKFKNEGVLNYDIVKKMFKAATQKQLPTLQRIFPDYQEQEFIPKGELAWVRSNDLMEWCVRFSDGKGCFYKDQKKEGDVSSWKQVRKFNDNPLI